MASTRAAPPQRFDRDGDGLVDTADRCPDAPEDCDAFEDDDGCPDPDNDRDRIPDVCDRCPNDPEIYGRSIVLDGCHEDPPHLIEGAEVSTALPTAPPERPFRDDGRCHDGSAPTPMPGGSCRSR